MIPNNNPNMMMQQMPMMPNNPYYQGYPMPNQGYNDVTILEKRVNDLEQKVMMLEKKIQEKNYNDPYTSSMYMM